MYCINILGRGGNGSHKILVENETREENISPNWFTMEQRKQRVFIDL
jgi:hypothetical protein